MNTATRRAWPEVSTTLPCDGSRHNRLDDVFERAVASNLPPGVKALLHIQRARINELEAQLAQIQTKNRILACGAAAIGYPTEIEPSAVPIKVTVPCITCGRELACEYTPKSGEAHVMKYGECMCSWDERDDARMDDRIRTAALDTAFNAGIDSCHRILDRIAAR